MMSPEKQLPTAFIARLQKVLTKDNYQYYLTSLLLTKLTTFRVNTLKISTEALLANFAKNYSIYPTPLGFCQEAFSIKHELRRPLTQTREFQEGLVYIQNPSSLFASLVLNPQPGEEVLDLAAAPGGKALHMAALMHNEGRIAAVEAVKERFFRLKTNIKQAGATIINTYCKDGSLVGRLVPERFNRVLLDAPCSSEARFDLNEPSSFQYWSDKKVLEMSRKQRRLIYSAFQALKPNGTLVYCTCSFAPEENEAIIQYALDKFKDHLEILSIPTPFANVQQGICAFEKLAFSPPVQKAIRIIPNEAMSGFFICKMRKRS